MLEIQRKRSPGFYAILSLPSTAMGFALSIQISALSWILSTQYKLAIDDIGLVWAAGPIAGIFGQVIVGMISDEVWFWGGRRRPFILIGGTLAALMLLALPFIGVISTGLGFDGIVGIAILIALTLDLSINISFNPTRSIIADVTPPGNERTKGYTWMQTISGSFGVGAYAIGAIWGNYTLIYVGAILVFLISFIPVWFIKEPEALREKEVEAILFQDKNRWITSIFHIKPLWGFLAYAPIGIFKKLNGQSLSPGILELFCLLLTIYGIFQVLSKPESEVLPNKNNVIGFQRILAAHSFTWMGVQTMFIYMFAFIQYKMNFLSEGDLGKVISLSFLLLNAVGAILPALFLQPISEKIGKVNIHLLSITIMSLGYVGIYFLGNSPINLYLLMAVLGIGWAATVSLPFAIMSQKVAQGNMGMFMGLFNLSVVLPQLVSSLIIGEWINQAENKGITFLISAGCLGISAVLWTFVKEPDK
jgi:MFS family permease